MVTIAWKSRPFEANALAAPSSRSRTTMTRLTRQPKASTAATAWSDDPPVVATSSTITTSVPGWSGPSTGTSNGEGRADDRVGPHRQTTDGGDVGKVFETFENPRADLSRPFGRQCDRSSVNVIMRGPAAGQREGSCS